MRTKRKYRKLPGWIYVSGASGGNCHHRAVDGDIDAGIGGRKETGAGSYVSVTPEELGPCL